MQLTEDIKPVNILDLLIKLREFSFNSTNNAVYIHKGFYENNSTRIIQIEEIIYRLNLKCFFSKSSNVILVMSPSYFRSPDFKAKSVSIRSQSLRAKVFKISSKIKTNYCSHKWNNNISLTESQLINYVAKFNIDYCKHKDYMINLPFSVCYLFSKDICVVNE